MNFHKTIGFLAALLLMVGLGAPDSFAQNTTTITLSRSDYVQEGNSVVVTVTLNPAPRKPTTVAVSIDTDVSGANTTDGLNSRYEVEAFQLDNHDGDDQTPDTRARVIVGTKSSDGPGRSGQSTLNVVVGTSGTGTERLYIEEGVLKAPAKDGDPYVRVQTYFSSGASLNLTTGVTTENIDGVQNPDPSDARQYPAVTGDDTKKLPIRDDDEDLSVGTLKLTASPNSFNKGATGTALTVILTVELPAIPDANVTVNFDAKLGDASINVTGFTTSQTNDESTAYDDRKIGKANLVLTSTQASSAGTVKVTASAINYSPDSRDIPIIARDAQDVEGFRVTIGNPNGGWVGGGSKKVTVKVTRLHNTYSYPWESFKSLAVSLRDTAQLATSSIDPTALTGNLDIITVTLTSLTKQDGNIIFSKVQADRGNDNNDFNPAASKNEVKYSRANDELTFKIELPLLKATGALTIADTASVLGTLGPVHPQRDLTSKGQRMGVFARAVFTFVNDQNTDVTRTIESKDTKTNVFSNPATVGADQFVGDGKLIKIDILAPANQAQSGDLNVTLNNNKEKVTSSTEAKIGDEIRVRVGVDSRARFIRDGGMQIQFKTRDNTDELSNAKAATLGTVKFSQAQISAAAGDSLRASLRLTEGKIKTQAKNDGHTRDGVAIEKNSTKYEPDYVGLQVSVSTTDQAGNAAAAVTQNLIGDTRKPGISVLYPANGDRFTGAYENADTDFEKYLNPLKIRVDEKIDSLYVHVAGVDLAKDGSKIVLWKDEQRQDIGKIAANDNRGNAKGDTIVYNTTGLKWQKANGKLEATGQGGTKVNLSVVAVDKVGNKNTVTLTDVYHDQKPPTIEDWFPMRDLLEDDNYQINEATRHPVFTLVEETDSIAVTYDPATGGSATGADIVVQNSGMPKGEHQITIPTAFVHDTEYTLTIFARDLAGNAFRTPANKSSSLRFNENFDNPKANKFTVKNTSPAKTDSVVANQAFSLEIQAVDAHATDAKQDRNALTYRNVDEDGTAAAKVLISAWDANGGAAESVFFHGKGVKDNGDGTGSLDADGWTLGKRTVFAKSKKALDHVKILVEHRNAGTGDTTVPKFDGAIDSLYVGAADFKGFKITAEEDGVETTKIWGDYTLKVLPVDAFGNASARAYKAAPRKSSASGVSAADAANDSLKVLDTRAKQSHDYKGGIAVEIVGVPTIEDFALLVLDIEKGGSEWPLVAPNNRRVQNVQVRVVNQSLKDGDTRSQNIRSTKQFTIDPNLMPSITVWDSEGNDVTGQDVAIPPGGSVTVTASAGGFLAGSSVTFTKDGSAMAPVTADANGVAKLSITMSEAGTVTVSAASAKGTADAISITFAKEARKTYADADGNPVYLVYTGDSPSDMTVDGNDFQAFAAAFPSSEGDDNYNLLADIDGDGDVDLADFNMFASSWGRTAAGASTKPLVLLPGINENAEFSLRLGSERVIPGELIAVDVALANVQALVGYGFVLHYDADKFEFVSVAPAAEDLLKSTGGETPLFHHWLADGQVRIANSVINGTAVSGGGDIVRLTFRVLKEFEENVRFEVADGLVFDPQQLSNLAVVAGVLELQSTPMEFALHQNFPNPFNPDTTIKYELAESADVTLQIYNVLGQAIRTLVASESQPPGRYQIRWNGMDDRGVSVSSGVYFYRISAEGKFHDVRKLMLLK